eukprot:885125-Pyramimonas_sp.AAC.1
MATTHARIPINLWKCTRQTAGGPARRAEHELDWRGQGAQRAGWRNESLAIVTGRLICQTYYHMTKRKHTSAVHLSVHARVDKGARTYVQSPKSGPHWDHATCRVTMNLDDSVMIRDMQVQYQPIAYI